MHIDKNVQKITYNNKNNKACNFLKQKVIVSKCIKIRKDINLNPRLSYNYFRIGKTNDRHIEILLPVSTLTYQSSSASHFASAQQISFESDR